MKRFWMKFLASSIVCTSLVSVSVPLLADTNATNSEQTLSIAEETETTDEIVKDEQVDITLQAEDKAEIQKTDADVKQTDTKVTKDGSFNMFVTGTDIENGTANVTLEITDAKGVSLGVVKTDGLVSQDDLGVFLSAEVPKYKENDVFRIYLKEADESVEFVRINEYFLDMQNKENYAEITIDSGIDEETEKTVILGSESYVLQIDVLAKLDLSDKLGIMLYKGNTPLYGEYIKVTDKQSGESEDISTLDSYVYFDKTSSTKEVMITLNENYYVFSETGEQSITIDLSTVKNGVVDLKVEKPKKDTTSNNEKTGVKLNVNITSDYNTELSTYWSNIVIKMQTGEGHKMLDDLKYGKNEIYLSNGKYTPTLVESKNAEVTGLPTSVDLSKSEGTMNLKVKPTHTLQVSKSKDGVAQAYKFKVINVPELADKVYTGDKAIEFAVKSGEAYMIQDTETGEVLNVTINPSSTVTKVVLGEGVVTGFASVPETGDNGTPLMLGLILSLAGVFIIGGKIVYTKRNLKPTTEGMKKMLSIMLIGVLITGLTPIETFAGASIGGGDGTGWGTSSTIPRKNAGLKGNMVRVYPAKLTQLGFEPSDSDYDANGTVDKLSKPDRNWLLKYSIYFTPSTDVYDKWVDSSALITLESASLASSDHSSNYITTGNYHFYDNSKAIGSSVLYHDYFDSDHTKAYMKEGAKQSATINAQTKTMKSYKQKEDLSYGWVNKSYGSSNLFVETISSSIVGKDIRVSDYGSTLQDKFSAILKDSNQSAKLWEDYKQVALDTGIYTDSDLEDLQRAYEDGKLGFFVETLMGMDIDGCDSNHGEAKHDTHRIFMSTNTYLKIMRLSKPSMLGYAESNKEYTAANKAGVGGCFGGDGCTRNAACKFFHHVGWLHANIKDAYTKTIKPNTTPIKNSGSNPFGGWGYLHLTGVITETKPGIYVIIKDATVREENDEGLEVASYSAIAPKTGSMTLELLAYEEYNTGRNPLADLAEEIIEGQSLKKVEFDDLQVAVRNGIGAKSNGRLRTTADTEVRVFLDSDYQKGKITDLNTEEIGVEKYVGDVGSNPKNMPLTSQEQSATSTSTDVGVDKLTIGGGDKATNWFAGDLEEFITLNAEARYTEAKTVNGMRLKKAGDLSDIVIVINDVDIITKPTEADPTDKVVPEWRLSKFWDKLVEPSDEVYSVSDIGQPKQDDPRSHAPNGKLSPSGFTSFDKKVQGTVPPYLFTKPLWGVGESGSASITRDSTSAELKVQGDLLAVKKNEEIDNIKVTNWVTGSPDLTDLGINSTNKGATPSRGSLLAKNYTFEYIADNPNTYTNTFAVYSHRSETCTNHSDSDDYHSIDICECYLGSESLSDETTGSQDPAKYPTNIVFERYMPRDTVAPKFEYKEEVTNGKVTLSAQSPVSLLVNPEVLMEYSDKTGRDNMSFTAGDKLREVKPVSYHRIEYKATVAPRANGSAVATDNQAKALASRLNAGGKQVIYKGSGVNVTFDINGLADEEKGIVETKSYILDIGNTAIKNTWNPSTTYNSQKISEQFLSKFASKGEDGKWTATNKVIGQLKIDGQLYGKNVTNPGLPESESSITEYRLTVRGGKLNAVNGDTNFRATLDAETIKAFEEMTLLNDTGVLSVFDKGQGKKPEASYVSLGNAVRGTTDLSTSTGWYNEDSTVLVVREYTTIFEVPVSMFADKIPMTVPSLTTPMNKLDFFTQGKTGHTVYTNTIICNQATLNPYDGASGTKDAVSMVHDSSVTDSPFGNRTIDYIVPNVSILDTMQ